MDDKDTQGVDKFGPQGHGWQYLIYISCGPELKWCNSDGSLTFWGMVGSIYVGDHWTLLYIRYISCGPELKWCNSDGKLTF